MKRVGRLKESDKMRVEGGGSLQAIGRMKKKQSRRKDGRQPGWKERLEVGEV